MARYRHGRKLTKPLGAERACFFIEFAHEQDVELLASEDEVAPAYGVDHSCQSRLTPSPGTMPNSKCGLS
jgi:hypothetical protein